MVKRAPADGYTVLIASIGVYAINPFLQKGLQYDPVKDFDHLTVAVRAPNVLVMNPAMPAKNVQEFVNYLKKMPGKVTFASSGAGSSDHLTAALFWQKTGTSGLHVLRRCTRGADYSRPRDASFRTSMRSAARAGGQLKRRHHSENAHTVCPTYDMAEGASKPSKCIRGRRSLRPKVFRRT